MSSRAHSKLTDKAIKAALPKDKPYRLSDGRGLAVLIHPNGGKYWQMRYRVGTSERTYSFGVYPEVTLAEARRKLDDARAIVRSGVDPSEVKRSEAKRREDIKLSTFKNVALDWYEIWKKGKDEQTAAYKLRRLKGDLFPHLGHRPVSEITRRDVIEAVKSIAARGVGETARRAVQVAKAVMAHAVTNEYRDHNPISDLKPQQIIGKLETKHYPRIDAKRLPELLVKIDEYEGVITRYAINFLCLTMVRTGTLRKAKWQEVDFENSRWDIPAENMKKVGEKRHPHVVPLSSQALRLLKELKEITGDGQFLFPGESGNYMSENTILKALARMGFKGEMTGHGFRGVASTILHEQGFEHIHIETQLGHQAQSESSAPYNSAQYLEPRAHMMQCWADYVDSLRLSQTNGV